MLLTPIRTTKLGGSKNYDADKQENFVNHFGLTYSFHEFYLGRTPIQL